MTASAFAPETLPRAAGAPRLVLPDTSMPAASVLAGAVTTIDGRPIGLVDMDGVIAKWLPGVIRLCGVPATEVGEVLLASTAVLNNPMAHSAKAARVAQHHGHDWHEKLIPPPTRPRCAGWCSSTTSTRSPGGCARCGSTSSTTTTTTG